MNFKEQTMVFLESYNYKKDKILEESIRNNSASNRLQSVIDKAESKMKNVSDKEAADIRKTLPTIEKARDEFLKLENAYKDSNNKKDLKVEYNKLKDKYSYQLKRIHAPKGVAATMIGAALAVIGATGTYKYNQNNYKNEIAAKAEETPYIKMLSRSAKQKEDNWNQREAEMKSKNEAFRKVESKSDETYKRENVLGFAKKLYKDGVITPDNRKSLDSYDFIDFKNALMSAYNVNGYMTEKDGKEFAKEYLKILETNAPRNHKIIMDLARRFMTTPYRQKYQKMMIDAGKYAK